MHQCNYVWKNNEDEWTRCIEDKDHKISHFDGKTFVALKREDTWEHNWMEDPEKETTVPIDIQGGNVHDHQPRQHTDGKERWCDDCGLTEPGHLPKKQLRPTEEDSIAVSGI